MKNLLSRAAMGKVKARRWLAGAFARQDIAQTSGSGMLGSVSRIWLLHEAPSATLDYLVLPALDHFGAEIVHVALDTMPLQDELTPGTLVVVVRYVNARWAAFLDRHRARLSGIVYFMDDDLFDKGARAGLPPLFVKKLERLVDPFRDWLTSRSTGIWVSSAALKDKYAALNALQVDWAPTPELLRQVEPVWIFYHGSASHQAEQRWLRDIVADVIEANESIHFEIIGDFSVNRMFRGLSRTSILHPMTWPNYMAYSAATRREIGLAPLLPSAYNAARGPTKFFDFARLGAAGLYTDVEPYSQFVRDGEDGILLPNDAQAWVDAVLRLADDAPLRTNLSERARTRALGISSTAAHDERC